MTGSQSTKLKTFGIELKGMFSTNDEEVNGLETNEIHAPET